MKKMASVLLGLSLCLTAAAVAAPPAGSHDVEDVYMYEDDEGKTVFSSDWSKVAATEVDYRDMSKNGILPISVSGKEVNKYWQLEIEKLRQQNYTIDQKYLTFKNPEKVVGLLAYVDTKNKIIESMQFWERITTCNQVIDGNVGGNAEATILSIIPRYVHLSKVNFLDDKTQLGEKFNMSLVLNRRGLHGWSDSIRSTSGFNTLAFIVECSSVYSKNDLYKQCFEDHNKIELQEKMQDGTGTITNIASFNKSTRQLRLTSSNRKLIFSDKLLDTVFQCE